MCFLCNEENKTMLHALVSCDRAKSVWQRAGVGFLVGNPQSFQERLSLRSSLFLQIN